MTDFDLINHKLEDLQNDISEIKDNVKNTCTQVGDMKERLIRIETTTSVKGVGRDDTMKFLQLIIPTVVSISSIVVAKLSGFIR